MPVLTRTGPASAASASSTTSTRPSEQRPAELAQQPAQAEAAVVARLALEVDRRRRRVTGGSAATRASSSGVGARLRRQPPPPPPPRPGPMLGAPDRPRTRDPLRPPAGPPPSRSTPRRSCRRPPSGGQRLDPVADRLGLLLVEPGQQRRGRAALRSISSSWVPCSTTRPSSSTTMRSARCRVERRWATSSVVRSGHARGAARRGWPPRCGRRRRWSRRRGPGSAGRCRIARASAIRWRWPPDRVSPRSPTTVS